MRRRLQKKWQKAFTNFSTDVMIEKDFYAGQGKSGVFCRRAAGVFWNR